MNKEKILLAGKIAKEVRDWIKPQIKKDMLLLDIAEKIENKIIELGGKPAFPVGLAINEVAAHYTPSYNDDSKAYGLLKVDFGVHIDGWISDNAFSVDLENSEENKKLIKASEQALQNAIEKTEFGISVNEIGKIIAEVVEDAGFSSVVNLGGHGLDEYDAHSEPFIPNFDNNNSETIEEGLIAIEPFVTNGNGKVKDGVFGGIYQLVDEKNVRSENAREILNFIIEEYDELPFCARWIVKEFGVKALFGLRELENNGNLHSYSQLIESGKGIVAQAEHTIFIKDGEKVVTTE